MKIGIDIGGSHIGIGLVNENGKIIEKYETDLSSYKMSNKEALSNYKVNNKTQDGQKENSNISEFIEKYIIETITKLKENYNIELIGVACAGTPKDGKITSIVNLGLKELDITTIIKSVYNGKIIVRNDAKCAALAEKAYGSLNKYSDCVFLCLGTGIGGSVFMGNKQLQPIRYPAFEIGHMVIDINGNPCNCGKKGCFETYCSIKRLKNKFIQELKLNEEILAKDLLEILNAKKQDEKVKNIINEYINNLIIGLSNIIDIFEPQAISLGGSFVYFEDILYKQLLKEYNERKYVFNKEELPELKLASLGNDAGIIGSVLEKG